ncbi:MULTISPECIES: glycosyltransferase [Bacteroides]|uniref:glycosyltransferase n=1 Tax=Bacteroides TaxID=816 RepID=UPI00189D3D29|nr:MULTISPECIES: glycosyltransferase family 4 protein [Bacteroides]MDC1767440.1 glycosyltransferase family 4 protein [Bacteroides uniformis]MDC1771064.1 glycosyltransferase family 4 protein [Bacteroides uniformis]MDC1777302.1 glycosyltransferase family 4 protein [Bacteroides uniformis]MDC1778800.1 glycosyltransferase family 4 protein [Bacteroides uniformis]
MKNLTILSRQNDVTSFYNQASVVLNLSDKTKFVETFGLTALEAMSAGLPVIVPTEGGIAEMVEDGVNGYKIDVRELDKVVCQIKNIFKNKEHYIRMANEANQVSLNFSGDVMVKKILTILDK